MLETYLHEIFFTVSKKKEEKSLKDQSNKYDTFQ